jgi:mitochondrial fission protein ELM1
VIIGKPLEISVTGDLETDVRDNLQRLISHYEGLIRKYPEEYLWTYKVWKYGRQKDILILSDGRPGHLRQSEAVGNIISRIYSEKGIKSDISILKIEFKSRLASKLLGISCSFAGKYNCQGCLWCLRHALTETSYKKLIAAKPDIVISAGSSLAPINYIIGRQNLAKSIVLMRPGYLSARRFDLVVMPYHDRRILHKNVVITQGALNLIDAEYLKKQSREFMDSLSSKDVPDYFLHEPIGLLVGGNSKGFILSPDAFREVTKQLKAALSCINNDILITTSRRTSAEIEDLLEKEFTGYPLCKKLIIANKENPPFAVGGIMGLAWLLVISPESISMISEAVTSGRQVLVIDLPGLSKKHRRFLDNFAREKYIFLVKPEGLAEAVQNARRIKTPARILNDNEVVKEALKKTL